jgi:tetratricopeptide (TPR) repeat protein
VEGQRKWRWLALTILGAAAGQVSGSRTVLLVGVLICVVLFVRSRWTYAAVATVAVVAGLGLGAAVTSVGGGQSALTRSAQTAGNRDSLGGGGLGVRAEVWKMGLRAFRHRPIIGHGPGLFRVATSREEPLRIAQIERGEGLYTDAHNVFVEYAVTTGFLGLLFLTAWLWFTARASVGPLAAAAFAILLAALLTPQSMSDTPLAFLFLGVGSARKVRLVPPGPSQRMAVAAAAVVAILAGTTLIVGDTQIRRGLENEDARTLKSAEVLVGVWPQPTAARAALESIRADRSPSRLHRDQTIKLWKRAIEIDPTAPDWWRALANEYLAAGEPTKARAAFKRALRLNPWSVAAMRGLARIGQDEGDFRTALSLLERALRVERSPSLIRERNRVRDSVR